MNRKWTRLLAALLAFTLLCGLAGMVSPADAVDVTKDCTITVKRSGEELAAELADVDLVLDVYQVAGVTENYSYNFVAPYTDLSAPTVAELWAEVAQKAAKTALEQGSPIQGGLSADEPIRNLKPGLYLLLAHGKDLENYVETGEDGTISTLGRSSSKEFLFAPVLVALPGEKTDTDGTVIPNDWNYDVEVTLKPTVRERFGKLRITKTLRTFEQKAYRTEYTGMFVFQIEGELDGKNVYSNVVALDFNGSESTKFTEVDKIPVGATVTVTEVYSGASYSLTSSAAQTAVIQAEEVAGVEFTNDYDRDNRSGHGIVNHFKAVEGVDGIWHWDVPDQLTDNASTAG